MEKFYDDEIKNKLNEEERKWLLDLKIKIKAICNQLKIRETDNDKRK